MWLDSYIVGNCVKRKASTSATNKEKLNVSLKCIYIDLTDKKALEQDCCVKL